MRTTKKEIKQQQSSAGRFQIISGLGVLIVGIFLAGSISEARSRGSAEVNLTNAGRTLFRSLEGYQANFGAYPSNGDPLAETFDLKTFEPLVREGELSDPTRISRFLEADQINIYCTPDLPTRNHDFWAILISKENPSVKALVADTDQYPGREGEHLRGVYVLRAGQWVSRGH